ncbi:DNA-nicking Smr family endonuclease [Sagittula marina]|uniref:DNA-nicking Smr family endonuclease n=1 Tax=Sagittula marina TaxID=943940 RepID=A0A7W6GS41_9RHOB|nr:Smr/MutS family protein [Sagittula marina]MBB3983734.1 DNA-nicking Smr family endonuclease [Sagittula marina]
MTRRRKLHPEEMDLWKQVARSTDPLPDKLKSHPAPTVDPAMSRPSERKDAPLQSFDLGEKVSRTETHVFPRTTADRLHNAPVRMDSKAYQRLKRGKLKPDARIDLHGMTLDQAHPTLNRFIMGAQAKGHRLVLVITGKGAPQDPYDPAPRRRGVLKQQVPLWMTMAPLSSAILQVSEAHLKHGGSGAYYVYLRRGR